MPPAVVTEFTPVASLIGGALIGLSAVGVMAVLGRIAGIAGITRGALGLAGAGDWGWRLAFLAGLVAAPLAHAALGGGVPGQTVSADLPAMALAGLLVGLGTAIGRGCTSGHGVCGLARLSRRSLAAVATFMAAAALTVLLLRHVI
jgi:uncharacterized membrane protein YedE/YeeE